jgi:hypothetical protein
VKIGSNGRLPAGWTTEGRPALFAPCIAHAAALRASVPQPGTSHGALPRPPR